MLRGIEGQAFMDQQGQNKDRSDLITQVDQHELISQALCNWIKKDLSVPISRDMDGQINTGHCGLTRLTPCCLASPGCCDQISKCQGGLTSLVL